MVVWAAISGWLFPPLFSETISCAKPRSGNWKQEPPDWKSLGLMAVIWGSLGAGVHCGVHLGSRRLEASLRGETALCQHALISFLCMFYLFGFLSGGNSFHTEKHTELVNLLQTVILG